MGEARRRNKLRQRLLRKQPHCIFCGGVNVAETVDHVPPRAVFDLKQRPAGLEFSACEQCNQRTRIDELVVAMLSRIYPDGIGDERSNELKKLLVSVEKHVPGLLAELSPTYLQSVKAKSSNHLLPEGGGGALNCKGPLLNKAILNVAAKLGFALHFEHTAEVVPVGGGVVCWWYTNMQAVEGDIPEDLLRLLPNSQTLQQGKKNVGKQFTYSSTFTDDKCMSVHFCTFRGSFAICAAVSTDISKLSPPKDTIDMQVFASGWLRSLKEKGY